MEIIYEIYKNTNINKTVSIYHSSINRHKIGANNIICFKKSILRKNEHISSFSDSPKNIYVFLNKIMFSNKIR